MSCSSTTRACRPGAGRPNERVWILRGSTLSVMSRPVSVIAHISTSGKPKRFSNGSCWLGSTPAHNAKRTSCRRSSSQGGSFSRTFGMMPWKCTAVTLHCTMSRHQVLAWKRSGKTRQPPVSSIAGAEIDRQFA